MEEDTPLPSPASPSPSSHQSTPQPSPASPPPSPQQRRPVIRRAPAILTLPRRPPSASPPRHQPTASPPRHQPTASLPRRPHISTISAILSLPSTSSSSEAHLPSFTEQESLQSVAGSVVDNLNRCPVCLSEPVSVQVEGCNHRYCDGCAGMLIVNDGRCALCRREISSYCGIERVSQSRPGAAVFFKEDYYRLLIEFRRNNTRVLTKFILNFFLSRNTTMEFKVLMLRSLMRRYVGFFYLRKK
ncbi:uncharacterized protein LOC142333603 [Lycorma delicatula]|uniref:uncharacterized protein LOC142326873 n=1 Tax=Lycorma delicatula TaxID=130591 RepID=UPI003F515A58